MNLTDPNWAPLVASLTLVVVMALAVRQDLAASRISNALTFGALAAGVAIHSLALGLDGLVFSMAGAGIGLAFLLPMYLGRGMGAGDVKLMAAAGSFLGPINAVIAVLLSLVMGAVIAVGVVVWRAVGMRTAALSADGTIGAHSAFRAALAQAGKERFPYAFAIALGVLATMWLRGMFEPLLRSFT